MKKLLSAVLLATSVLTTHTAAAHGGGEPKHGGIVKSAHDLTFELVPGTDGATLYIEDHGRPFGTVGMSGKLTVLNGKQKAEADLKPAGGNTMRTQGLKLDKGATAVATLQSAQKKPLTVRFKLK